MKVEVHTLPHATDDLPAFIGGISSLETPLDGPVSEPGVRLDWANPYGA